MASGNTHVLIEAYRQSDRNKFTIMVRVTNSYQSETAIDVEF